MCQKHILHAGFKLPTYKEMKQRGTCSFDRSHLCLRPSERERERERRERERGERERERERARERERKNFHEVTARPQSTSHPREIEESQVISNMPFTRRNQCPHSLSDSPKIAFDPTGIKLAKPTGSFTVSTVRTGRRGSPQRWPSATASKSPPSPRGR